jgi:hypothetical protein
MARNAKITQAEREEAKAHLRKLLKPGATVYCILRHVSTSGMLRVIDLAIPVTATRSNTLPATAKGFKIGADAYYTGRDSHRSFSNGRILAYDADTVTITYQATADGRGVAEELTFPRDQVSFYKREKYAAIRNIGYLAARAMGDTWDSDRQGIKVGGCGMDMGFHLVYSLGSTLWPKGTPKPHGTSNGEPDRAGGYALKKEWL